MICGGREYCIKSACGRTCNVARTELGGYQAGAAQTARTVIILNFFTTIIMIITTATNYYPLESIRSANSELDRAEFADKWD